MAHIVKDSKETEEHLDRVEDKQLPQIAKDAVHVKNAVGYKEYLEGLEIQVSDREARAVRWKIDLVILPAFLITQALQFMDKTALNYANLFGYQKALGLEGQQFNYLSALVYAGYFFGQYPCGWLLGRFPAQRIMAVSILCWGALVLIMTQCRTYSSAAVVRFLMGIFEAAVTPAWFLNQRERLIAVKRVVSNETGIKNKSFDKKQAFVAAIPNGVVNSFSTIIIRDMGFGTTKTTELKSVGDATQIVALFIGGAITLNVPNSRLLTATAANILCTVSAALLAYLPRSNTWGRLVCFWLVNAQSVGFTVSLTTISSNMAGYTHRSLASALVFTAYCWGNFAGPFVVKESQAPYYEGASIGLLVGYCIKLGCHLLLLAYMFLENRRRDKTYGPANKEESDEAGMLDQTEFENRNFRYVL
ncbi:hypothetical protein SLS57_007229 [Botryosphaeria dothidea]